MLLNILQLKSLPEKLELLELCSEKMQAAIDQSLETDEEQKSEFEVLKLTKYIGKPAQVQTKIEEPLKREEESELRKLKRATSLLEDDKIQED